jgi:hypothetical protein
MSKRLVLLSFCIAALTWIAAKADVAGIRLLRIGRTEDISAIDEQMHRGMKWSHGAYLVMDEIAGQPPIFYSVDRSGIWTDTARFENSEPTQFGVFSYDREADGTIVFSGETWIAPRVASPFLAWTSADGQTQRMMRTDPYFPYEVSVAPDGTIWTLGFEMVNLDPKDPAVNKEAHVLRHFDRAGNLIGSAFPQSQFDRYQQIRLDQGILVANRDRLGWYGPRQYGPQQREATYTEISLDTMTMKEYSGIAGNASKFHFAEGLALTDSGIASISIDDGSASVRTNYVLDRTSSKWLPVSVPLMGGFKFTPRLIGSDGESLVFKYGRESGFFSVMQ